MTKKKNNEVEAEPVYDTTTYGYRMNKDGTVDLVVVRLNSVTGDSEVENETQRYTEEYRAVADVLKRVNEDFYKGKR